MKTIPLDWDPLFLARSPAFDILRPACEGLDLQAWPDVRALSDRAAGLKNPPRNSAGRAIEFVEAQIQEALAYEQRTFSTGEVACRTKDWHDFMNALAWMTFPSAKAALNARHMAARGDEVPGQRGRVRDTLTVFDEGGAIVLSSNAAVLEGIRNFRWKEVFWERRAQFTASTAVLVVGHALHQKLLTPFIGLTAQAMLLEVPPAMIAGAAQALVLHGDACAAALIADASRLQTPQDLAPLPILGVPGWCAGNDDPAFYDDVSYFRPGRSRRPGRDPRA